MDQMADHGTVFRNTYCASPVCTPARGSIQTERLKFEHRAVRNWAPMDVARDRPTLARAFADAGYRTGYVGKWHLDGQTGRGATTGDDAGDGAGFVPPGVRRCGYGFWSGFNDDHAHHDGHPRFDRDGRLYRDRPDEWQPTVQTDVASEFVGHSREEPFLLFLSWGPPHPPFRAPDGYDRHDPGDLTLPPNVPPDLEGVRENLAEYYGMIEARDDDLARLLDALEEYGVAEETVVAFTADHGELMGSHGYERGKSQPYEEAARVPLVLSGPGIDPGRTSRGLLSLVDLFPTLSGLCDVPVPDGVRGRDRSAHVRGAAPAPEEPLYLSQGWRAVRTDRHLLRVEDGLRPAELYDLETDPYQQEDLLGAAGGDADPELVGRLLSRLVEQAYRFRDYRVAGDAFRRGSPWGPNLDDEVATRVDVDYERYGPH